MFDNYTTRISSGSSRVDVNEHRAPTDESIRLLREMEEKASSQVAGAFVTKSNAIEGVVVYMRQSPISTMHIAYIRFRLNGEDYEIKQEIDDIEFQISKIDAYKILAEKISNAITNKLMVELITGELK